MTANTHSDASESLRPIHDSDALRDHDEIPYHETVDTVPEEVVDQMDGLPDLAAVGVTNEAGDVLLRRLTETCSWKLPAASVAPDEDFAAAIRTQILATIGLSVDLTGVAGVWEVTVESEDGDRSASRTFVVFEGRVTDGVYDLDAVTPTGDDPVEDVDWFEELPGDADELPGTDLFFG
jgi:hypothetical protein